MHLPNDAFFSRWLRNITVAILVLVPFHAFITVSFASIFGQYTVIRLWKEILLIIGFSLAVVLMMRHRRDAKMLLGTNGTGVLFILILGYIALHVLLGGLALAADMVTPTALGYAYVSNLRFIGFFVLSFGAGLLWREWFRSSWPKLLLWPAAIVVGFGLLQFLVLPADFLRHFGYGPDTITPYIAVDQKPEYDRVQSTLRGPNPLGAYLVIIATALFAVYFSKRRNKKALIAIACTAMVLIGTYSRSAWIGVFVALLVGGWALTNTRQRQWLSIGAVILAVVFSGMVYQLRDNDTVQNLVFHTDETSQSDRSSNEDRSNALVGGFKDVIHEPFGRGPGTAGPASVYNDTETRLSENYFLQIGQEVGVIGLLLFVAICWTVVRVLWSLRAQGTLPLLLCASFIGLTFVNLLSHAWADDTLAYIWWGFAGLAIGSFTMNETKKGGKFRAKKTV